MSLRTRLAAAGFAAAVLFSPVLDTPAARAQAPAVGVLPAAAPACSVYTAADWVASQYTADPNSFANGDLADAITALAATGYRGDVMTAMTKDLGTRAANYVAGGGAGAGGKLLLAVQAAGQDPTRFHGVNLVQSTTAELTSDPTAGGNVYSLSLAMMGLVRADAPIPAAAISHLVASQDAASGAYGYTFGGFQADPDYSGIAMQALAALKSATQGGAAVATALDRAVAWAKGAKTADGYWTSYSPANATALVGQGLMAAGREDPAAEAYLTVQLLRTGNKGLPNTHNGTQPNVMATIQSLPLLVDKTFITATYTSAENPCSSASTSTAPTSAASTSAAATATATATKSGKGSSPAPTSTTTQTTRPLPNTGAEGR